jgi:hypothetical protein
MGVTEDVPLESTVYPTLIDDGGLENMSDLSLPIPMSRYGIDLLQK